ncbi:MAG: twin-arginine translocase subunit TatC [Mucilaginibacter sp.]|uniref:twin-arginine translocase subunit TatC n=1 Tax=Mucilaginibacter sp. L3T2-6 TaxID=3062491 RepID=UPI002674F4D9|nr:twin-arginine translocase subunit TatC [Mucilaginibacter sp. L3T2-6]MDO3643904.1 twin-arginine translocase subunit TatC [Mucilaginibacter sp. L3T2-6]MDV6216373.1 twin-arginine translocase subunit TatC [Mucilaginibacter sp. L3T2-6]
MGFGKKIVQAIKDKGNKLDGEMSFFEHLEELRWHLIRAALAIVVFAVVAFVYYDDIFTGIIMAPTHTSFWAYRMMCGMGDFLQGILPSLFKAKDFCVDSINVKLINTEMAGQFTLQINSSLMIGLILGIPYLFWELWRFIKPALHEKERKAASGFVFYASLLFLLGVMFGYFIITPLSIRFLAGYKVSDAIQNLFSIDSYISSVATLTLATGVVFQLPILVYIVASLGFLTPKLMRKSRRYAIVVILIIAAVVTPTPDALTMTVVAIPLFVLYELSIVVAGVVEKRRAKKELMNI